MEPRADWSKLLTATAAPQQPEPQHFLVWIRFQGRAGWWAGRGGKRTGSGHPSGLASAAANRGRQLMRSRPDLTCGRLARRRFASPNCALLPLTTSLGRRSSGAQVVSRDLRSARPLPSSTSACTLSVGRRWGRGLVIPSLEEAVASAEPENGHWGQVPGAHACFSTA